MEFIKADEDDDHVSFSGMEAEEPVSPIGQYFNSSVLSLCVIAVLEFEIPIDDSSAMSLIKHLFLTINPRFSSIMVTDKYGVKQWRRVEVKLKDHVKKPIFPSGLPATSYDNYFNNYLSNMAMQQLPQNRPLWEIHIVKYPTTTSAANIVFKLHHALGDGYSLISALLSCLQRADNPSLPLTFPSIHRKSGSQKRTVNVGTITMGVSKYFSGLFNSLYDFGWAVLKTSYIEDDTNPIRSGDDGVEFREVTITNIAFSLDEIKLIKSKLQATVNDVITGIMFFGVRSYMQGSNHNSSNAHSTSLVLLNTRYIDGYKTVKEMKNPNASLWGNQFAFLHIPIPKSMEITSSNPLEFILHVQKIINRKRNSLGVKLTGTFLELLRKFRGPEYTAKYLHSTLKNTSMTISNLVGPVEPMALANHPVKGLYFAVVGAPQSISFTMLSYKGELSIAMTAEKGFIDTDKLKSCVENAFRSTLKAAEQIHV